MRHPIVIEGPIGAGKTSLARMIASQSGNPLYRPFRPDHDSHHPGADDERLSALLADGFTINSWQEDLYIADMLAATRPTCVLDRSMPSALFYCQLPEQRRIDLSDLWAERMLAARAVLLFLDVPEHIRISRAAMRFMPLENQTILEVMDGIRVRHPGLRMYKVRSHLAAIDDVARTVLRYVEHNMQFMIEGNYLIREW